jgi:hypothetical protein
LSRQNTDETGRRLTIAPIFWPGSQGVDRDAAAWVGQKIEKAATDGNVLPVSEIWMVRIEAAGCP